MTTLITAAAAQTVEGTEVMPQLDSLTLAQQAMEAAATAEAETPNLVFVY